MNVELKPRDGFVEPCDFNVFLSHHISELLVLLGERSLVILLKFCPLRNQLIDPFVVIFIQLCDLLVQCVDPSFKLSDHSRLLLTVSLLGVLQGCLSIGELLFLLCDLSLKNRNSNVCLAEVIPELVPLLSHILEVSGKLVNSCGSGFLQFVVFGLQFINEALKARYVFLPRSDFAFVLVFHC